MKLSIIIPVYNNYNFTKTCLKDLSKLPNDHEVIVVDNGSSDETTNLLSLEDLPLNFVLIQNDDNYGFSRACNQGFERAVGEYILFLNNDIKVQADFGDWTQKLVRKAIETNGLVGPTGGLLDKDLNFVKETDKKAEGNFYMSGWCLCAKRYVFEKLILKPYVGPFSEQFGKAYFEDTDLGFRASRLGIPMDIVPVPVVHFGKMTSRKLNLSELYSSAKAKFVKKWLNK